MIEKTCKYCQCTFYATTDQKQYCGSACSLKFRQGVPLDIELTCPGCQVVFTPKAKNQKWCSRKCQLHFYNSDPSVKEKKKAYYDEQQAAKKAKKDQQLKELRDQGLLGADDTPVKLPKRGKGEIVLVTTAQVKSMRAEAALITRIVINIWKKSPDIEKFKIEGLNPEINFKQFAEYPKP